jgi:hypothetical protein
MGEMYANQRHMMKGLMKFLRTMYGNDPPEGGISCFGGSGWEMNVICAAAPASDTWY